MRVLTFVLCAAVSTAATAQPLTEINYPTGSLGINAILASDFATAERQIRQSKLSKYDPARALNLGHVLARTGRTDQAAKQFTRVLFEEDVELILADGRPVSSHQAARKALTALGR